MITLPKFRELIGSDNTEMTDDEVEAVRQSIYQLAEIAFDFWQQEKSPKTLQI